MNRKTKQLALCGLLAALAAAVMALGTIIPIATYCCPVLASLVLIAARAECGKMAWGVWAVSATLSILLAPDKEAAALYALLGYYPLLKPVFDGIKPRILRLVGKLLLFNVAVCSLYALLLWVFQLGQLMAEFQSAAQWVTMALLLGGNLVFALYDVLLVRLEWVYRRKFQKILRKML